MNIEIWFLFALTIAVASAIPGPSSLVALTHGVRFGWKHGMITAAGTTCASCIQAFIAVLGLGVVIAQSGFLFLVIKYAGVVYLMYLGIQLFRHARVGMEFETAKGDETRFSSFKLFTSGFVVAAGNPKAIVFFTALFPQFLEQIGTGLFEATGVIVMIGIIAFLNSLAYAFIGSRLRGAILTPTRQAWFNRITGGLFIGGGLGILAASR